MIPGMSRCSTLHLRQAKNGQNWLHIPHFYAVKREFAKEQSIVELQPRPEQVVRRLEGGVAVREVRGEDWGAKDGVLPIKINLHELVQVPVQADVDHLGTVGPEVGIGQAGGEDD